MESKYYALSVTTVFFVVILFSNTAATPAISSTDDKYVLNIESCKCLPITRHCEVSISSKVWPHLKCQEDHQYCCQLAKKTPNSSNTTTVTGRRITNDTKSKAPEVNPKSNNYNNTRYIPSLKPKISPPRIKYMSLTKERTTTTNVTKNPTSVININRQTKHSATSSLSPPPLAFSSSFNETRKNVIPKVKISCSCQLKENCPKNFTDHRFNACPNERVKCCTPVSSPEQLLKASTKINPNANANIYPESSSSCFCLPKSKCKLTTEMSRATTMAKLRPDSVCPLNLIQCCGNNIVVPDADERSDQVDDTDQEEVEEYDEDDADDHNKNDNDNNREDTMKNINEEKVGGPSDLLTPTGTQSSRLQPQLRGALTDQRQPIQLPQLRVPLDPITPSPSEEVRTSTIPPPQLPTQYYYTPPNQHYKHLYTPSSQQQQNHKYEEQQRPNNYYFTSKNSSPWVSNGFSDRSGYDNGNTNMNIYGRGLGDQSRSSSTGSFFNSLALLFG